ncbi:MAG: FG-GAP-like repeat-containing protein [Bryobacterales bacterium]|nr:FG-GAP-like repeat-containing protein [Bryobacterales bacterium]MDE0296229.1 FG-GAP-like repeat-containing protein [Bryobacterales bacterium]MDE0436429.1 FG-GAP-like repeat-containing protein [Bryobacterales bacterium]
MRDPEAMLQPSPSWRFRRSIVMLLLAMAATAGALAQDALRQARQLYQRGDFGGAVVVLNRHLSVEPEDDQARMLLGVCHQRSGNNEAAEAAFLMLEHRNPGNPQVLFMLALTQFTTGKYDQAESNGLKVIASGTQAGPAHHLLGMVYEERNALDKALASYEQAIKADRQLVDAYLSSGSVLLKLRRPADALPMLDKAVELRPGLAEAHYHRARARIELGQLSAAREDLETTVRLQDHRQARSLLERVKSGEFATVKRMAKGDAPKPPAMLSPIRFRNVAGQAGLDFVVANHPTADKHLVETMAGGMAAFDYDNDGLTDIFFANGAETPSLVKTFAKYHNRLFRNVGNMEFRDVTAAAGLQGTGYSMGAAAGDFDNDGYVDLFVPGAFGNLLYRNLGNGRFEEITANAGVKSDRWSVAAGWFDYDNDGFLDLFVVDYLQWSPENNLYCGDNAKKLRTYCHPKYYEGHPNTLYRNKKDGTFEDVSEASGIASHVGKGMSVAFADYDQDGHADVFITNDTEPNFLFRNRGDGVFEEVALEAGPALTDDGRSVSAMGMDFRDYDNDSLPDIIFTALVGETFPVFRNEGGGVFRDATYGTKVGRLSMGLAGWGIGLVDFNNDGWKDLFTANSHVTDNIEEFSSEKYRQNNAVWANTGHGTFQDMSSGSGEAFQIQRAHRGSAFADFNNDGRVDVVVSSLEGPAELWENISAPEKHWIRIRLKGVGSNRDAIGARVSVDGQHNQMTSSVGYSSSSLVGVHFGLGDRERVSRIEILWPSGAHQVLQDVASDQVLTVIEPDC